MYIQKNTLHVFNLQLKAETYFNVLKYKAQNTLSFDHSAQTRKGLLTALYSSSDANLSFWILVM